MRDYYLRPFRTAIRESISDGLDWISIDKYREGSSSGFINSKIKEIYKTCIYPKMKSHHRDYPAGRL